MNQLLYTLNLICQRRQVDLRKIESVAFNVRCAFGLANLTALLPAAANTFYYIKSLHHSVITVQVTNPVRLRFAANSGQGSVGDVEFATYQGSANGQALIFCLDVETDSLLYVVNGNTAGVVCFSGEVFKITYA